MLIDSSCLHRADKVMDRKLIAGGLLALLYLARIPCLLGIHILPVHKGSDSGFRHFQRSEVSAIGNSGNLHRPAIYLSNALALAADR